MIITTETFLTEHCSFTKFYSQHSLATKKEKGRPEGGGITIMYRDNIGSIKNIKRENNLLIIKTEKISIIGLYVSRTKKADDVAEHVIKAINKVKDEENVILAGDLNCRIDKPDHKTELILELLEEENFKLINKAKSTIDLVFIKGDQLKVIEHEVMYSNPAVIPVATRLQLIGSKAPNKPNTDRVTTRKLQQDNINARKEELDRISTEIENYSVDEMLEIATEHIRKAQIHRHPRHAKPWYDRECYALRRETLNLLHEARRTKEKSTIEIYSRKRKSYKKLIHKKRAIYSENQARKQALEATTGPFIATRKRLKSAPSEIPMTSWETHFNKTLNRDNTKQALPIRENIKEIQPIEETEIENVLVATKDKKPRDQTKSTMKT